MLVKTWSVFLVHGFDVMQKPAVQTAEPGAQRLVARADLELRSSPPDKRLVPERVVYELASEPKPAAPAWASAQLSFEAQAPQAG